MRPDFGCGIYDYVFAPINTSTIMLIEASVREALVFWEPRIQITGVKAVADADEEEKLLISIDYTVRTTNNRFNLVYPFYLKESR
jgi:phage baseplate assembly protein W